MIKSLLPVSVCVLMILPAAVQATPQAPAPEDPSPGLAQAPPPAEVEAGPYAPDVAEPGSVEAIARYTTSDQFLPETVSYLPDFDTVPSPVEILGRLPGTPDELSRTAEVHHYFRALAGASPRVKIEVIGTSEEGREILLATVSSEENLGRLDDLAAITTALADPRATGAAEARTLAAEGKVFYHLLGGLHSPETGSPEMLMELAYRLAVSEVPEIRDIRDNVVVMITPVVEPDGRDRMVDWYYRHLRGRDLSYRELREFSSPPYWGHYVYHDNNRDGMQLTLALTRAINQTYFRFHPQIVHDLHESLPLLYISTGHGPYSRAVDPVTVNEWTQFAHHEAGALQAQDLPGVWVWGFWDGWWPGYLFSVANNHNSVGRFYETFGNSMAGTFERELKEIEFVGKAVTEAQWYRPWPPGEKVEWSLRNNTNYMQAGVLEALGYAAVHRRELLKNFWVKGNRALEKGRTEAPHAWIFPAEQRDPGRLAYLIDQLRRHGIEVHRLSEDLEIGETAFAAGDLVVRMDQPYRNAAINFLEEQKFPPEEPNPPYDDVAWTWPLLYGVSGERIDDRQVLETAMEPVLEPLAPGGQVEGFGSEVFLLRDQGQTALLAARLRLAEHQVDVADTGFDYQGVAYPPGSWIVYAPREEVESLAADLGLSFEAALSPPEVERHVADLPRVGIVHTWTSTQDTGWVRYTLDRSGMPYRLVAPEDLRRGDLGASFDLLLFPRTRGDFKRMVHGIDPARGPLAYTQTAEFPSHGVPNASPDITGGMGFGGLMNLRRFVEGGGVLVMMDNAGTLAVDGGLVRRIGRVARGKVNNPGSEIRARVLKLEHPIAYGYEEVTSVFRGNGPLWEVHKDDRSWVVAQFGAKLPEGEDGEEEPEIVPHFDALGEDPSETGEETIQDQAIEVEELEIEPPAAEEPEVEVEEKGKEGDEDEDLPLLLSGFVKGEKELAGKPAILDLPVGEGRVILFAFNPLHRYLNHSDFRFVWNVILNWNDLPED